MGRELCKFFCGLNRVGMTFCIFFFILFILFAVFAGFNAMNDGETFWQGFWNVAGFILITATTIGIGVGTFFAIFIAITKLKIYCSTKHNIYYNPERDY